MDRIKLPTPRETAKFVISTAIAAKATSVAEDNIVEHTRYEEDDLIVVVGSKVIGMYTSAILKPFTDKAVDKTADFVLAKREARKAKKTAKKQEQD